MLGVVRTSGLLESKNGWMAWSRSTMELDLEMHRRKVVVRVLCVIPARVRTMLPVGGPGADLARTWRGLGADLGGVDGFCSAPADKVRHDAKAGLRVSAVRPGVSGEEKAERTPPAPARAGRQGRQAGRAGQGMAPKPQRLRVVTDRPVPAS